MKIAVIGIRGVPANYGGFETCAEYTSKYWVQEGNEVLVYCRKSHYKSFLTDYNGVRLRYIRSIPLKGFDTLFHALLSIINLILKEPNYKHVHLYNTGNGIFIPLLKLFGRKVIVSVDGIEWKRDKWGIIAKTTHKVGAYIAVKLADSIITDNKEVFDFYKKTFGIETKVIEYGAKFINKKNYKGEYLKKYNIEEGEYYLFVGRFVPEKGVHHLINAYLKLKTSKPLVIIGDDTNLTKYRNDLFQKGAIHNNIIMTGFLYNEEYEELLANAFLYVSASELEGTSPSLLAAMGAEVCVLVNGIEENIQTIKSSGLTFKKSDYEDLVKVWQKCEGSPEHVSNMAYKGYRHVNENYQWHVISKRYINLFRAL